MGRSTEARCPANSVIVGRKGTLDNPMLIREPFWNIDTCFGVIPNDKLDAEYLWRFCQKFDFYSLVPASGRPSTTSDAIKAIQLPLPELAEQRKIAASVDKAIKRVDAIERQFEKLRETAAACFKAELDALFRRELFAGKWPMHMLKEHVDVLAGYAFKGDSFSNVGIKICGGLIIMPDRIKWEECKYWRDEKGFESFLLAENDIVVALDRPWISTGFKVGKIEMKDLPCLLIQRTARLRARDVDPDFLLLLLRDRSFREHCSTSGTTVPHISHKDIETFAIPVPSKARQNEVVAKIADAKARCDGIAALATRGLANCARMRKAILAEAFAV